MKRYIFALALALCFSADILAQPPGDSSPTYPQGATYVLSNGSTVTLENQTYDCSTQYYNVVQVSNGTLYLNNCSYTKTGDGSSGDNSSFYGNNSSIYAGAASSTNYESTTAGANAVIHVTGGTVTSNSQGANAVFATNGATIYVDGLTIINNSSVSRGLHATYNGTIIATNVDITTNSQTSSTIATDRGGGTVSVTGGTATANGSRSAVIYSTGTMSATDLTGTSAQGEMAVIEGDNSITMTNCTMTSGSSERGLLMMQSGSGDASGYNPVMTITGTSLTMTDASAPLLEVATAVTATCTLDNCTVNVPSGILMYVMDDDQWSTSGAIGTLVLSNGTYSGQVKYDAGYTANVTVNSGATWNLTANTTINTLVNNGTIVTNGYTLNYDSYSGSGTIVESGTTTTYTITATANPTAGGTVSGTGTYTENTTCILTATANSGYTFTNWTLNGTEVSTSSSYSFTVTGDADYVANFEEETPTTLDDNCVTVVYNGTTATVTVADNLTDLLTVTQSGAHISIAQSSSVASEITYTLSGSSDDGEFYMSGSYKATIELNGLTLTNTTPVYSGAAVHIQNGKRINVKVVTGTTNTLTDASSGSQKGCLYVKGHAEFKQQGTLNVVGNVKHGIKAGEYISIKNATINVTSAEGDGISCNEYFLMQSGTINISGTGDDGIQCDLDGDTSTGITTDHEDEDSGNIYISGGTINITCDATAAKGIKSGGDTYVSSNAVINVTTTGDGEWDEEDLETKAACGLSADGNLDISGGTLTLTATGSGGKGMKCDTLMTISGGDITVVTSGGLYYNNGTTENLNYTGNTDNVSSSYYSSPKGIKAGTKTEVSSNSYTYSGGIVISGGTISVTTSGNNAEGIESKNTFNISGGEIYVNAYDDGINSAQDLTITGGYVYARATNNDGMDSNGNFYIQGGLVYAMGASSPEVALDANTEGGYHLYISGGTIIAVGGIESSSYITQTCYQASSVSSETWYSMTYGSNVVAFYTPESIGGGNNPPSPPGREGPGGPGGPPGPGGESSSMVISASSTPTLKSGVTVTNGTSLFEENCYLDATVSGGTNVSLSQYNGNTPSTCTITATANPTAGGTVSGTGSYYQGSACTLTATANSGYTFTNWTLNDEEVSTSSSYSFTVTENADYVANFTQNQGDDITQSSTFAQGWNWWSTYVEADDLFDQLTAGLGSNATQIKSSTSFVNYYSGYWVGDLSSINNESCYLINANNACTLEMTGNQAMPANHPITINPNWNWIGYPNSGSMSIENAFSNFTPANGDQVKSQNAFSTYYGGIWVGGLSIITPGMGLLYKSNSTEAMTLIYPEDNRSKELMGNVTNEDNHWTADYHAYPNNMTVTAVVELDNVELNGDNYEIAAFVNGECRGSAKLMYVEPINRYLAFLTVVGDEASELRFSLYDDETGIVETQDFASLQYETNAIVGNLETPYVIRFRGTTGLAESDYSVRIYPNPAKGFVTIEASDDVTIFNSVGQVVRKINDLTTSITLDVRAFAPGLYFVRSGGVVKKMIVE